MKNGTYDGFEPDNPGAYVKIARETSDWKSATVRYADIAGGPEREAVVLLSRSRGGVPWPDAVVAYDQNLLEHSVPPFRLLWSAMRRLDRTNRRT